MENLPTLSSTNENLNRKGRCIEVSSLEKFCTKGKCRPSNGTNFILRNIQLVSRKKEEDSYSLFLTEFEKKKLEEILNDDNKERCKRKLNLNEINSSFNAYKLTKQNELSLREIDIKLKLLNKSLRANDQDKKLPVPIKSKTINKLHSGEIQSKNWKDLENLREINNKLSKMKDAEKRPVIPVPEDMIKKLIQNFRNSSIPVTEKLKTNKNLPTKNSNSKLNLKCDDQTNVDDKTGIHEDVLQKILQDVRKSIPLFQYRF